MDKGHSIALARATAIIVTALTLIAISGSAIGSMITWKGVAFETTGEGTATINNNDDLLLNPTSGSFGVRSNRIPDNGNGPSSINANDTPFISFSYDDPGNGPKIDFSIQDETVTGQPRILAGSLFGASQVASATYGPDDERDANEDYLFFDGRPRSAGSHDVILGKSADSTLYVSFDGEQRSSDIFKNAGIAFDFNDISLRVRNGSNSTIRFTDLTFGDDFVPASTQDVPEPGSLAILGLGGILLMLFGVRQRRY